MNRLKHTAWIFSGVLLPLVLLVFAEGVLRWTNYGHNLDDLFLSTPDKQFLYLNPHISKRYFTSSQATTGNPEFFRKEKTPHTVRIFVLGESAALGFPYSNNISFQRMLKYELQMVNPDKEIELINLSLTAVNSSTFYDFALQLPQYKPDAVLIYGGHNEYYGALGAASTSSFGNSLPFTRTIVALRQTRLVQWLEQITSGLRRPDGDQTDNLMKYVVGNQLIAHNSPQFLRGIERFERNMTDLLSLLQHHHIPVFCSTVATNLKDQYPFRSLLSAHTDSTRYNAQLRKADSLLHEARFVAADSLLSALALSDSLNARCSYLAGMSRLSQRDSSAAYRHFNDAKQKDGLRFRAPDEINRAIDRLSARFPGLHKVDAEARFRALSPYAIPGKELLLEHVHPTIEGHRVIARSFLQQMNREGFFASCNMAPYNVTDRSLTTFPVLEFDSLSGAYGCAQLRKGFPFYEEDSPTPAPHTPIGRLALGYVKEKNWFASMELLYKHAISQKDYRLALDVLRVRMTDNPYDASFRLQAGNVCSVMAHYHEALTHYRRSFALTPSFEAAKESIAVALRLDLPNVALLYIDYAASNNRSGMDFNGLKAICTRLIELKKQHSASASDTVCAQIAQIYTQMGNNDAARRYRHNPSSKP